LLQCWNEADADTSRFRRYGQAVAAKTQAKKVDTAWGQATLVDEIALQQKVGDRRFSTHVQLLEGPKRERLVRFAYATDGSARRGPVTLGASDLRRLRAALARHPEIAAALGLGGDA
jgi:hypothetical protein